jgi:hypothetical protein
MQARWPACGQCRDPAGRPESLHSWRGRRGAAGAWKDAGLLADAIQLVQTVDRAAVGYMLGG